MLICPNMSNPDVAREFNELKSALMAADPKHGEAMAYLVWSLNNGNAIDKAPNGAESLLFKSLMDYYEGSRQKAIVAKAKVYSNNFFSWFGDWTQDNKENVSKVVDENGEPFVVYRGDSEGKTQFNPTEPSYNVRGIYIAGNKTFASNYIKPSFYNNFTEGVLYEVFINAKNPIYNSRDIEGWNNGKYDTNDSWIYGNFPNGNGELVVRDSNQIKHVDNRDGEYTGPNIYHNEGEFDSWNEELQKYYTWLPGAKQRLALASSSNIEQVKSDIKNEFDRFKFKHFTISILKNKEGRWYIRTSNRNDQKDVKDLRKIAKTIGYTELGVHELSGEQAENLMKYLFSEVHGSSEHMNNIISILKSALKDKNIKIRFVRNTVEDSPAYYDHETGVITININGAFKNSNGYDNIAAQTVLHELLHAVTVETIKRSPELRKELETLFEKVKNSARIAYGNNHFMYGLKNIYEFVAELSNEDFVKLLRGIHTGTDRKNLISTIIDFMRKVINRILTSINKKWKGTAYADAMELLLKAAFPQDFNINLLSKPLDELTIFNDISARQQAAQDEANRLITRMNVLYRLYEKIKDKTPSQERLANQIFETLNRLKQHRDISAILIALDQAKLTLGLYNPTTGEPVQISSIYKYLYDAQQNGFSGISPQSLVDMYRNSIKFYKDLIDNIPSEQNIDLTPTDKNSIAELKSLIEVHIMPLWTLAIMTTGDQIVDDQIDSEVFSSDENKEDMKKVAKDWLHKNLMYGDINAVTSYVYNYSNSSNPIIKQAFHLIQAAEQKTLEEVHGIAPKLMKAYQKANTGTRSFTPGWQSMMMEFDDKGIPTGNFVRNLNYGLYQKDFKEFLEKLNENFIRTYGYTYVIDDTGAVTNSLTGEFAEDEEWGPNGEMPKYIEYLREIEYFKEDRVFRRYLPQYYIERLSRPYDGTIDPMSIDFKGTRFHHGLSPKTLARYTYYLSNINYYLNKCQDSLTGLVYPERLSSDDQLSLDRWKDRLDKFTSIFNDDGSYKIGEDLKMAYEVRAWQKWIGEYNNSDILQDDFNAELNFIRQESIRTNNPKLYNDFIKYNSRVGINPDFIKQTVGDMKSGKIDTDTSLRGKLLRASLLGMVSNPRMFGRELKKMENNPLFWLLCKTSDQAIEDANDPNNKSGWDKEKVEAFLENFYQRDLLYVDEYGFFIDESGNKINPNDPSVKSLEDAGKLLTFRSWLINKYTDEAFRTGQVNGLIDESTGQHIDFSGMSQLEIRNQISNLLSYKKTYWDEDGNVDRIENEPLTIFSVLAPTKDTFFNSRTNRNEPTIIMVGDLRFKDSHSSLQTPIHQYNPNNGISELPNKDYDNGRYDNSEAYNKVMNDDNVRELYELLIQTMLDMQNIYSTNRKFNYKLPLINARTVALISRIIKRGYSTKSIQGLWNSITNIEANDELLRTKLDYFVGVDGEVANDVPLKFIRELKNKEDLTTDIVSSVIMFVDMALNYKNKSEVDAKLKVLRYNMDEKIREVYESKLKPKSKLAAKENKNSLKMFDSMMDVSMYGNKFGNTSEEGPSKARVALHKTADVFLSVESNAMLGLNMFSMMVGFGDSLTRIFAESAAGKYMTIGDCLWALGKCLYYTPACIKNMFNPVANNKMTALMQMNGISKGTFGIYTKADWGKGRKFLTNILMGGWSMLDWMANALLMTAFYHNCRLYEGNEIPKGFYTKYEMELAFLKAGKTKADGKKAFHNYAHLGSRITLWDAYGFSNGQAFVKPEYEAYVTQRVKTNVATKTKKRGALYNGMNPDNDIPRWKRDVIGRLAGALRAWIQQQVQHLIAGGTDNIVRTFIKEQKPEVTTSGTRMKTKYKKEKLTDEQRSRQMAWDYETGTPQDQIMIGLFRSFKTLYKQANQTLLHKPRTAKLSEVEKYAWKDTIIFLAMLAMMMVAWTSVHDWAREVEKPLSRKDAGPASMLNPVDYYEYVRDIYIPREYYRLGVDDVFFRVVEAKISSVNVQQVLDIVNALTALKSGFDNQLGVIELSSALIGDEDEMSGILKQGGYKFYTKGEKALYKAVGPVNNLHTFLTYYGATGNLRWYTNKFGKLYRAFGYDFKTKDKAADNKKAVSDGEFSSGGFDSGGFEGDGFSGGDSF